jgi:hypothetical protein
MVESVVKLYLCESGATEVHNMKKAEGKRVWKVLSRKNRKITITRVNSFLNVNCIF